MMMVQGAVPLQPPPLQPPKVDPVPGLADRVTIVPTVNDTVQFVEQLMPGGALLTVPDPPPDVVTVSETMPSGGLNVAVTD
jgi:hypothetical protein